MASAAQVTPDTPVTIKVTIDGLARRFKFPLRDVGINVLESKLRTALSMPADAEALFERYSDSAAAYVVLDQTNTAVYKQLYRAAKAKHKLKLRVTTVKPEEDPEPEEDSGPKPASVADEAEEESHPSVEPTDTEREAEQPTSVMLEEKPSVEAAPASIDCRSLLQAPSPPPLADISPRSAPIAVMGCPAMRANYAVCCNSCDRTIPDSHYHCSTCDDGDFDLCQDCVDRGVTCKGTNHWLIKRFVKNGVIINSTTERLAPKPRPKAQPSPAPVPAPIPVASERIIPVFNDLSFTNSRTCNCCVAEMPAAEFLHCTTCEDFDLCRACFAQNRHGHHPKHAFVPAVEGTRLEPDVARRLSAGRGQAHNAICDGCDKNIRGIRHKCLDCPDWDYCSDCVVNASFIHQGHRFAPIYEPLEYNGGARLRSMNRPVHVGICCDGPLCASARTNSTYIVGDRYKCAVCHDTDFCASCEASPANSHNRTHPLIKFKTPVRHVSVTTTGENVNGRPIPTMGDRPRPRPAAAAAAATSPAPASATTTPRGLESKSVPSLISDVQTVVDVKPTEPVKVEEKVEKAEPKPVPAAKPAAADDLVAIYVRDTVQDGTVLGPDHVFEQTWVLRNDGKVAWPAGCSVRFVGGDYMGHLDSNHPAATKDVEVSCESTICYASIQPGEEFPFTVLLRTPHRPGRVVSNWRLTTKDGHKFGHRLWCDVCVAKPKVVLPPVTVVEPAREEEKQPEVEKVEEEQLAIKSDPEVETSLEHSQMIFPKLEKESPVASVHEADAKAADEDDSIPDLIPGSALAQEDEYEDCEWNDDEDEDEAGFLTDEEYDVLDASDEESLDVHSKQK